MPVQISFNGDIALYSPIKTEDKESVLLENDRGEQISVKTPLNLDPSFEGKDFDLYFLAKKDVKESNIFQVYDQKADKRIGWIIPTISLGSDYHDFANDEHFLKYAYIGIKESLMKLDDSIHSPILNNETDQVNFENIFHEYTVLLIISRETLADGVTFDINRATPSLIKYGYVKLSNINPDEIQFKSKPPESKKLNINNISSDINSYILISDLLNKSFVYEEKAAFRFFYIYQIIELLIDDIYKNEQEEIVNELISSKGDSGLTKEALEKMQLFLSEKKRINLLVGKYTKMSGNLSTVKSLCNKLLKELGRKEGNDFQNYFYTIRNYIFHQYRDFPTNCEPLLEDIVNEFVEIIGSSLFQVGSPKLNFPPIRYIIAIKFLFVLYPLALALAAWIKLLRPSRMPFVICDLNHWRTPFQ